MNVKLQKGGLSANIEGFVCHILEMGGINYKVQNLIYMQGNFDAIFAEVLGAQFAHFIVIYQKLLKD